MTVVGAATTFIIRQATESSVPAELRQATSDNRPAQVASKPISQREIYIKAAGSLNTVKTRVELWDTNGLWSTRPELKRDGFLMVNQLQFVETATFIAYMNTRLFLQNTSPISEMRV